MKTRDSLLAEARELLDLWFTVWGPEKAAGWTRLTNDAPYNPDWILERVRDLLVEAETAPPSLPSLEVSTPAEVVHVFDVHKEGKYHVVIVDGAITEIHIPS